MLELLSSLERRWSREETLQSSAGLVLSCKMCLRRSAAAGIPYEAIDIDVLADEQHILDLVSLTRAIHFSGDRISWLACLRAPWCGLTLVDLSKVVGEDAKLPISERIADPELLHCCSADSRLRLVRFGEVLHAAQENFGRVPVSELVRAAWVALGGPAALRLDNHRRDAETFFGLLEALDVGGVIPDFNLLNERLQNLFARPLSHRVRPHSSDDYSRGEGSRIRYGNRSKARKVGRKRGPGVTPLDRTPSREWQRATAHGCLPPESHRRRIFQLREIRGRSQRARGRQAPALCRGNACKERIASSRQRQGRQGWGCKHAFARNLFAHVVERSARGIRQRLASKGRPQACARFASAC